MSLDGRKRRELAAKANRVPTQLSITGNDVTDGVIEHIRACLARHELIKVRVQTDDRDSCDVAAGLIAERVPCDVVQRLGRVITFYRARPETPAKPEA